MTFDHCVKGASSYFWEAPSQYIGNRLVSYGQRLRVATSWHRGRGDTAGYFTKGPDMVLVGDGGVTIATGFHSYSTADSDNATLEVMLMEEHWYHVPDHIDDIPASGFSVTVIFLVALSGP